MQLVKRRELRLLKREERKREEAEKRQEKGKRTNRFWQAVIHWKKNLPTGNALSVIGWTSAWQPNPVTRRLTRGCPSRDSGPLRKGHCQLRTTLFLFDDFVAVWIVESRWVWVSAIIMFSQKIAQQPLRRRMCDINTLEWEIMYSCANRAFCRSCRPAALRHAVVCG